MNIAYPVPSSRTETRPQIPALRIRNPNDANRKGSESPRRIVSEEGVCNDKNVWSRRRPKITTKAYNKSRSTLLGGK